MSVLSKLFGKKSMRRDQEPESSPDAAPGNPAYQPGNPYLDGRREWLERYGDYIAQAYNWRRFALAVTAVCALSAGGNVIQAMQYKVIPYVVSVDSLGNTHSAGAARGLRPTEVPAVVIQADLANFIRNWRSVTADADLQNRMLERVAAFSSGAARSQVQQWFNENNPYKRAESTLVSVEIKGLPQQVSNSAWRVEWTESTRDRSGKTLDRATYECTLTVGVLSPDTEEEIIKNPLGVMVADIYFSKLLVQ